MYFKDSGQSNETIKNSEVLLKNRSKSNELVYLIDIESFKPNRTKLELFRMVLVYFGIELLFSIEVALTVPILLKLNVSERLYSYVYFFSPLVAFFFQPILGSLSDRCNSRFGRRKPFIFILSLLAFIGITLILNGHLIGKWFGDKNLNIPLFGIFLTTIGVTILDFSADSCDCPLRAYILDSCNSKDKDTCLNIHAFLGGIGAAFGFILTSIDWNNISLFKNYLEETQILYIISSIIFIICLVSSMTSVKEEKLIIQYDEKTVGSIKEEVKILIKSFTNIPKELKGLLLAQTFGWLAFFSTTLFFTDFVAQSIYLGDPNASVNSKEYFLYNYGIKMGSYGLLSYSISSAICAILLEEYLLKNFSTKSIFLVTYLVYIVSCIGIYNSKNIMEINIFCASFGLLLTALCTLPYRILSDYHQDKTYVNENGSKEKRGIGIDCSLLASCYFLSQTILSTFMSFFIFYFGNRIILIMGGLFAIIGFFINLFIVSFPDKNKCSIKKLDQLSIDFSI